MYTKSYVKSLIINCKKKTYIETKITQSQLKYFLVDLHFVFFIYLLSIRKHVTDAWVWKLFLDEKYKIYIKQINEKKSNKSVYEALSEKRDFSNVNGIKV